MIKTTINQESNVLKLTFAGDIGPIHFQDLERHLPSIFRCLRPDFGLLLDLSGINGMDFTCMNQIAALMERIVDAGVGNVTSVTPQACRDAGFGMSGAFHVPASLRVKNYADRGKPVSQLGVDRLEPAGKTRADCLRRKSVTSTGLGV